MIGEKDISPKWPITATVGAAAPGLSPAAPYLAHQPPWFLCQQVKWPDPSIKKLCRVSGRWWTSTSTPSGMQLGQIRCGLWPENRPTVWSRGDKARMTDLWPEEQSQTRPVFPLKPLQQPFSPYPKHSIPIHINKQKKKNVRIKFMFMFQEIHAGVNKSSWEANASYNIQHGGT